MGTEMADLHRVEQELLRPTVGAELGQGLTGTLAPGDLSAQIDEGRTAKLAHARVAENDQRPTGAADRDIQVAVEGKLFDRGVKGTMQSFQVRVQSDDAKEAVATAMEKELRKAGRWAGQ